MPEIPVAGFLLEALGAVALALMLSSIQQARPRAGVRDWSLGLWFQAAGLLASIAVDWVAGPLPRTAVLAVTMVLAYWSPALVLLGTWCRWNDRESPSARRWLLGSLAALGLVTTAVAPAAAAWGSLLRAGTFALLTMAAQLVAGALLLRARGGGSAFGPRVLGVAFLGGAIEAGLFLGIAAGAGRLDGAANASVLVEAELVLLMLTGVGMVAWLLEEERESAVRLQEALHRKEALSAMGTLVGGVAHEVRNPLFGISATLDALRARLAGEGGVAPLLATMGEQVRRLSRLMTELLDYGRPIASELTRQSVSAAAARSIAACAALSEQDGGRVELEAAPRPDVVLRAEPRLQQVFQTLVQTAVQHTPREGRVRVEVGPAARRGRAGIRCTVHDSGPGFEPALLPRVFEPFFSGRRGGTGLGLSIVQRIVEQHSGHVEAANGPGGGAAVTVWLPVEPPSP
jgi:signal transduction histidine kinase